MSPPSTPRGSVFSPRQRAPVPWSFRTISAERSDKRQKLAPVETNCRPMSPGASLRRSLSTRSPSPSSLAARRLRRNAPTSLPIRSPGLTHILEPLGPSTGLTPVVKNMSFGTCTLPRAAASPCLSVSTPAPPAPSTPTLASAVLTPPAEEPLQPLQAPIFRLKKPARPSMLSLGGRKPAPVAAVAPVQPPQQEQQQQPMLFRLQKPARPSKLAMGGRKLDIESAAPQAAVRPEAQPSQFRLLKPAPAKAAKGSKVPAKLDLGPTGLISPPETSRGGGRPPPLSLAGALALPELSPSSPCMPLTPGAGRGPINSAFGASLFGEASPSLYDLPTPPPVDGAPSFMVTPPSPAVVAIAEAMDAVEPGSPPPGGERCSPAATSASASLAPCTPPWPKTGASLRKTIFDHIGKPLLSPFDLRGYMAISMNS
ncbi:hypothetical protein H4R19_000198 [Coemansia spiralis]|nr:hypothetical protein H4R19_000198 [Coemansia spiralis]